MTSASARLGTERLVGAHRGTRLCTLRSDWPLMLRSTAPAEQHTIRAWVTRDADAQSVHLAAGGAGPVGGDRLRLHVEVGPGSALVLREVSPTLLLPGAHDEESRTEVDIHVGAGGALAWLPELVIAACRCRHRTDTRVTLDAGARLLVREEILFGRHGEPSGTLHQRLRVVTPDGPVHDQELAAGVDASGWEGPAVTDGHRGVGSMLIVDPDRAAPDPDGASNGTPDVTTAVMQAPGSAVLVSALAHDTATLRRRLDDALERTVGRSAPVR